MKTEINRIMKKSKELSKKHYLLVHMPYVVLHVLLKHNALSAWYNNTISSEPFYFLYVNFTFLNQQPERWIDYAFFWFETPEKKPFWYDIYKEIVNKTRHG